jgi:hypothetical protein
LISAIFVELAFSLCSFASPDLFSRVTCPLVLAESRMIITGQAQGPCLCEEVDIGVGKGEGVVMEIG